MSQEIILQGLGIISVTATLGFLVAYYTFPPNLSIGEVKDKGKYNFESRLIIKNIGNLPAFNVVVDVSKMNFVVGSFTMENMNIGDCGIPTATLASGEKMEIPACPHSSMPIGTSLQSCDYNMTLKYQFRLPFYSTIVEKHWYVKLRNSGSEFTWQATLR